MTRKLAYRVEFQGLPISVENRKGSNRYWHDPNSGEDGKTKQHYPYGYVRGTLGVDGDEVDIYLGPDKQSDKVFIVTQMKAPEFSDIDEQKTFIGFSSPKEAKTAYLKHFDDPKFFGSIKEMTLEEFKTKLKSHKGKLIKSEPIYIKKAIVDSNIFKGPYLYLETN